MINQNRRFALYLFSIFCLLGISAIFLWALFCNMTAKKRKEYNKFFLIILILSILIILVISPFMVIVQLYYLMNFSILVVLVSLLGYLLSKTKPERASS